MVADPDPDGTDPLQVTVGLLEQVIHQLVQATLDCHLRVGGVCCVRAWTTAAGSPAPCHLQPMVSFLQAKKEEERPRGTKAGLRATLGVGAGHGGYADQLSHWP